jgi:hypothetical protein
MDQKAVAFARSWATRYVRTKHPHGLDVEDVENRVLESLYKYGRGKMCGRDGARPSQDGDATAPQWMMKALSEALNEIQRLPRVRHHWWTKSGGAAIGTFATGGNVRLHEPFTDRTTDR